MKRAQKGKEGSLVRVFVARVVIKFSRGMVELPTVLAQCFGRKAGVSPNARIHMGEIRHATTRPGSADGKRVGLSDHLSSEEE
eukprot:2041100-Rhodomonas_salina.1